MNYIFRVTLLSQVFCICYNVAIYCNILSQRILVQPCHILGCVSYYLLYRLIFVKIAN